MRLPTLVVLLVSLGSSSFCQTINSWQPKAGRFFEFDGDRITVYFDADGLVSDECAAFARVGHAHPTIINVEGPFVDYDRNGKVVFRGTMHNNELNGPATYYYGDGSVKETGTYRANKRDSTWTYYYSNGVVERVYIYQAGEPLVWEASGKNGKRTVSKGTGEYRAEQNHLQLYRGYKYFARGAIKDGKKHGEWVIIDPGSQERMIREFYHEGRLVSGKIKGKDEEYTTHPKIAFIETSIHEQVSWMESHELCYKRWGRYLVYKNVQLEEAFYRELTEHLNGKFESFKSQWLAIDFAVSEFDRIEDVKVVSSIHDAEIESVVSEYLRNTIEWGAARTDRGKTRVAKFFTMLLNETDAIVPVQLIYDVAEQKIFYNNANEITVAELASHFRTSSFNSETGFSGEVTEYDNNGNRYMVLRYDRKGKKEGKFWYDRNGLKIEGLFINNRPNQAIPDSILKSIETKEKFKMAKYVRKREHGRIRTILMPDMTLRKYFTMNAMPVVTNPDVMPDFPGGREPLFQFIAFHFVTPEAAKAKNLKGTIKVEFTVMQDGSLRDFQVIDGLGHGCDEAAVEALKMVPDWVPGKKDGNLVPVRINLDVPFPVQ